MKKIFLILLYSFSFFGLHANRNDLTIIFEKGNKAYEKEAYTQAIFLYESILQKGYENAALHYNLGNAYFRSNNYGKAILNYERSLRLNPSDKTAQMNLQIVNAKTTDKMEEIPPFLVNKWWLSFIKAFSLNTWALISLGSLLIFCLVLGYFLLSQNYTKKRMAFYTSLCIAFLFIFSIVCSGKAYSIRFADNQAIVMDAFVQAKSSPAENGTDKFVLHEGSKIIIEENLNNWAKIKLPDGNIGWIPESSFEII